MRMGGGLGIGGLLLLLILSWATGTDLLSLLGGDGGSVVTTPSGGEVPPTATSPEEERTVDMVNAVAGDTQATWARLMGAEYEQTRVVLFRDVVQSACGMAESATGPFYCPGDHRVYLDLGFFSELDRRLGAPGDFAQAYVIAHEVGHHVQNLIGATNVRMRGETQNQVSVRVELQADCLAGVWGHTARASLAITDDDLKEAVNAAHAIGDDALGHTKAGDYTHGTSEQRMRWFRRGFTGGDARQCDTFAVAKYDEL
jgi:predicted metalloprotease